MLAGDRRRRRKRKRRRRKTTHPSSLPDCGPTASVQDGLGLGFGFGFGLGFGRAAVSSAVSRSRAVFPHWRDGEEMFH